MPVFVIALCFLKNLHFMNLFEFHIDDLRYLEYIRDLHYIQLWYNKERLVS